MGSPLTAPGASLRLTVELAEKIRSLTLDGLKDLPRRGGEFGGLIIAEPSVPSLAVDLALVRYEHRFGLSGEDIPRLADAASQCREEGKVIAAYFRGSARSNGVVDPEDRRAIAEACPEAVFAVIARPAIGGNAHIRIFRAAGTGDQWMVVRELNIPTPDKAAPSSIGAGAVQPQEALRTLHDATQPRSVENAAPPRVVENPARLRVVENAPAPLRVFEDAVLPSAPPAAGAPLAKARSNAVDAAQTVVRLFFHQGRPTTLLLAVVLVLAGVVIVATRNVSRPQLAHMGSQSHASPQPVVVGSSAETQLGLAVRQEAGQLHLTWTHDSIAARTATTGTLQILDGASPVSIRLAASDVTEGSLVYAPHSPDVTFRLRLGAPPGPNAEEMIRVIGVTPAAPLEAPVERVKAAPPPPRRETEQRRLSRPTVASAPPAVRADSRSKSSPAVHAGAPQRSAAPRSNLRTVQAQNQTAQARPPQGQTPQNPAPGQTAQAQPVQPQTSLTTAPSNAARQNSLQASGEPVVTGPEQSTALARQEPVPAAQVASLPGTAPPAASRTLPAPSGSLAVGYPTPVRRVEPALPGARWKVLSTTRIAVLVDVDARGFVTNAQPESPSKGVSLYLEGLCLAAARQWTFKPATISGKPVAGKYQIEFVFKP